MKFSKTIKTLLCLGVLGGAFALVTTNEPIVAVKAEEAEEKDMSFETMKDKYGNNFNRWQAANGDFVSVDDWFYSNKGFSFEFKFKDENNTQQVVAYLRSHGTNITSGNSKSYLIRKSGTTIQTGDFGEIISLGDGWYRFETMFAEMGHLMTGTGHETVDELYFAWATGANEQTYYPDVFVRNMKTIDFVERELKIDNSHKNIWANNYNGDNNYNRRWFTYSNWKASGKGFFFEFKQSGTCQIYANLMGSSSDGALNKTSITSMTYFVNGGKPSFGKLRNLGNEWYRFEAMFDSLTAVSDTAAAATIQGINFNWGAAYAPTSIKSFGIIDDYSKQVTFKVDGEVYDSQFTSGLVQQPVAPTKDGYHFSGWATSDGTLFDFTSKISEDIELTAVFDEHSFTGDYQSDDTHHWKTCECGEEQKEAHTFNQKVQDDRYLVSGTSCLDDAVYYYSCVCGKAGTTTFTVENSALGHEYGEPTYVWNGEQCTAKVVCVRGDDEITETVTGVYVKDSDATCVDPEKGHYEATFENSHFTKQSTAASSIEKGQPLGHEYSTPTYAWNGNKCTAKTTCTKCGAVVTETVTGVYVKDSDATCVDPEKGHYEATFKTELFTKQSTAVSSEEMGEALGHEFSEGKCTRCGEKDPDYVAPAPTKGCKGSVIATSAVLSSLALVGVVLVSIKKKEK